MPICSLSFVNLAIPYCCLGPSVQAIAGYNAGRSPAREVKCITSPVDADHPCALLGAMIAGGKSNVNVNRSRMIHKSVAWLEGQASTDGCAKDTDRGEGCCRSLDRRPSR
jgi:hypothetical protein